MLFFNENSCTKNLNSLCLSVTDSFFVKQDTYPLRTRTCIQLIPKWGKIAGAENGISRKSERSDASPTRTII